MSLQETLDELKDRRREKRWFMRANLTLFLIMMPVLLIFALSSDERLDRCLKAMPFLAMVVLPWATQLTLQVKAYLNGSSAENIAAMEAEAKKAGA